MNMSYVKNLLAGLLFGVLIISPLAVAASTISLTPASVTVHEGETFVVNVGVNAPTTQYTVKMDSSFTPGILRLSEWSFNSAWTVLRQPGYDTFNNDLGFLVRTAGYTGGFTGSMRFGKAIFVGAKVGKGVIELGPNSFVYDQNSANTYTGANKVMVTVLPAVKKVKATSTPVVELPVDHSFDIALVLGKSVVTPGEDVSATVHLTNLSSKIEALTVPVRYTVISSNGTIATDQVVNVDLKEKNIKLNQNFGTKDLPLDTYTVVAKVEYPNITSPAESQGVFTISAASNGNTSVLEAIIAILAVLLFMVFVIAKKRKNKAGVKTKHAKK